jgi:hypothetical protein
LPIIDVRQRHCGDTKLRGDTTLRRRRFTKSANLFTKKLAKESPKPNPTPKKVRKIRIAEGVDQVIPEKEAPTDSANTNLSEDELFEKDLVGIYAGPIGKVRHRR